MFSLPEWQIGIFTSVVFPSPYFLSGLALDDLHHARKILAGWRHDYDHVRPHSALDGQSPIQALQTKTDKPLWGHAPIRVANDQTIDQNLTKGLYG